MEYKGGNVAIWLWLALATSFGFWFDYAAATALFNPERDSAGHLIFKVAGYSNTVYPFTYVAVALSFVGVCYFCFIRERKHRSTIASLVIGALVANAASIGMINVYEQFFVSAWFLVPADVGNAIYWSQYYWGSAGAVSATVSGLLLVLTVMPWSNKRNLRYVMPLAAIYAMAMLAWIAAGYGAPRTGNTLDYLMNAISRISSQLMLVAAVATPVESGWQRRILAMFNKLIHT